MIDVLEIQEKRKAFPLVPASLDDFTCRKVGEADPSLVVTDSTISLYCLDHAARRAMFVQVPEEVDITAAAFIYMAQYDHAQRLLSVPYDTFHQLAAGISLRDPLVFIYSTGRAGSTLLSKAFGEMGSVRSLSEPDVYSQAVAMRLNGGQEDEIRLLLASTTRILFNPASTQSTSLNVVKFRSPCIELADLLYQSFPDAGSLFLYRDLASYIRSAGRAFPFIDMPPEVLRRVSTGLALSLPLLAEELRHRTELDGIEIPCFFWLCAIHAYVRLHEEGIPMLPVRYEELVSDPSHTLQTILAYLGLPTDSVQGALLAFDRDSQAGSPLSREEAARRTGEIGDRQWQLIHDLVRRYPFTSDGILKGSVAVP